MSAEDGAAMTRTARDAILAVAQAFKASGKSRDTADAALTVTVHADWIGLLNGVLDEVYPAPPMIPLQQYIDEYQAIEVPEFGFEDREGWVEYEQAEARAAMSGEVMQAVKIVAAGIFTDGARVRPTTSDEDWDRDDEEAEIMADTYDECAHRILATFGLDA